MPVLLETGYDNLGTSDWDFMQTPSRWPREHGRLVLTGHLSPLQDTRLHPHPTREIRVCLQSDVIARSQINVVITPSITNIPTGTWWEIDWDKHPDGVWRARRIELVWVAGLRRIGPR